LTGTKPIASIARFSIDLENPKKLVPTLSTELDAAIMKAMALRSNERYQTITEFLEAINENGFVSSVGTPTTDKSSVKTPAYNDETIIFEETKTSDEKTKILSMPSVETPKTAKEETIQKSNKKPNRTPIFIGIGVLLFFLVGFGIYALLPKEEQAQKDKLANLPQSIQDIEKNLVYVQGGSYMMGSSDGQPREKPVHKVTLSSFKISKYEVTQAQWKAVMGTNPSNFKGCDNCPVEQVSWNDTQTFLKKLNELTGKKYRLLSEAEWEYAARGGNKSKGYKYAGSNSLNNVAWHNGNSGKKTHPVGQKQPNELGLYDMTGNVYEWCQDWYDDKYYEKSNNLTNPINKKKG
jgi:formylglycine-generating enzyme required for sulfatase activity